MCEANRYENLFAFSEVCSIILLVNKKRKQLWNLQKKKKI